MSKGSLALLAISTVTAVVYLEAQSARLLTAPTFYIAASGQYGEYSATLDVKSLDVKGASNLPPGSRLSVALYDFVGYKSSILSEDAVAVLNKDGFFEVTLKPRQGKRFKDNMVCDIVLFPRTQDAAVVKIIGRKGEFLGIEKNPQIGKQSGENYCLESLVHIP